ncbi:ATP-binding protein [Lachnospiraceae bacterium NSJ-143]|nr:ATP-binding protein [Lachnospiraceae bacterium NSJ-143]
MYLDDRRVRIIAGHYGSGKTEFAVNYVTNLKKLTKKKVAISDMDIVNVYFRSRERRQELISQGIEVFDSSIGASADLPAIPKEMVIPFLDKEYDYVVDLGGNDVGTIVLGRFREHMDLSEVDFFMVVNVYRPDTQDVKSIIEQKERLEFSSKLKVTGFINNSNLIRETTAADLLYGDGILREASRQTGVPIKYTSYVKEVVKDMTPEVEAELSGDVIPLKYYMREVWM